MSEINQIYVGENKEFFTIADTAARNQIANLDRVVVTPLPSHPQIVTGDTIDTAFSKTEAQFEALGDMAFKDNLTKSDVTSALDYDPQKEDEDIKKNFQDSVETICEHIEAKGSPVAEPHSRKHVCDAIDAIQTGGNYGTLEVNADGDYYPPQGIDAWNYVKVSKDVGQTHTVVFYDIDGTTVLKTQVDVPYHGYASCNILDGTTLGGKNFKGWNPPPDNIIRDTACYPIYGEYKIESGEIEDDWETICANKGAKYPIGAYKNLILNIREDSDINNPFVTVKYYRSESNWTVCHDAPVTTSRNNQIIFQYSSQMVKVAEGEDGSSSTWISSACAYMPSDTFIWYDSFIDKIFEVNTAALLTYAETPLGNWNNAHCDDQETSSLRRILNGKILNSLEPALKNSIKSVNKYSMGLSEPTPYGTRIQKSTIDKIWVPSVRELNTILSTARIGGAIIPTTYSEIAEINGIDYTANYTPVWPDGSPSGSWWLRTQGSMNASPPTTQVGIYWNDWGSGPELVINNYSSVDYKRFPFGFCL